MARGMSITVLCETCGREFKVGAKDMVYRREFDIGGRIVKLSYFKCRKCGRIHFVQIDDDETESILESYMLLLSTCVKDGKTKKRSAQVKQAYNSLKEVRGRLMKEYTGKLIRVDEVCMPLEFTIFDIV